jgi:tetratricopeptide (TPR) repeat protein
MASLIGAHRVFMDVEGIQPGENFAQAIEQTLSGCSTVLVVVGPHWHEILEARAKQNEQDYVVHEIAAALAHKKTVVPVFVGGAQPASLTALPVALADLSFHQAVELRDTSFKEDCDRLAKSLHLTGAGLWFLKKPLLWLIATAALVALLLLAINAGFGPWSASHDRKIHVAQLLNTASSQIGLAEYESAFQTYEQIVSLEPNNRAALDGQVDAAMLRLENFHVLTPEGQKSEDIAAPLLAQLKAKLEAGLARTNGKDTRAADILAHLGWAHWMNEKIAFKEFDNAERFFRQALAIDPSNVFANAFIGNWLLQTNGDSKEALTHFQTALATNKYRDLVRSMQLGGLYHNDNPGMRAEFVKALNQVRIDHEPLDKNLQDRLSYLYSPTVSDEAELHETLTAVPVDDAWKTYLWLNPHKTGDRDAWVGNDFIHANLTELSGNRTVALAEFKTLSDQLRAKHFDGFSLNSKVAAAIKRLAR